MAVFRVEKTKDFSDDYLLERKVKLYDGVFCCKTDNDLIARITTLVEYGK